MYTLNYVPHILASEVNLSNLSNLKLYLFDLLQLDIYDRMELDLDIDLADFFHQAL